MAIPLLAFGGGGVLVRAGMALFAFSGDLPGDRKNAVKKVATLILRSAKEYAPHRTGALRRSGRIEIDGDEVSVVFGGKGTGVDYAPFVEYGRAPGRMPPPGEMFTWAARATGSAANAFVIARAIAARGVRPTPYLRPAMMKHRNLLPALTKVEFSRSWNRRAFRV